MKPLLYVLSVFLLAFVAVRVFTRPEKATILPIRNLGLEEITIAEAEYLQQHFETLFIVIGSNAAAKRDDVIEVLPDGNISRWDRRLNTTNVVMVGTEPDRTQMKKTGEFLRSRGIIFPKMLVSTQANIVSLLTRPAYVR